MNKSRILGGILLLIGIVLMFKIDSSEKGWIFNALIGAIVGGGFVLTIFGGEIFKAKI